MNKQAFFKNFFDTVDLKSSLLFLGIGLVIISMTLWNWHYDVKPRLINEAQSNTRVLASSYARSIESQFQNVTGKTDISVIHNSINEMLLINDPTTGENLYYGISLEVDYDAFPADYDLVNFNVGTTSCKSCIITENPIYKRGSRELIAILKIYANPVFYQRLVEDIVNDLALMLIGIIIVLVVAWLTSNRLMERIRQRERSLVYEIAERKSAEERLHQVAAYDQLTNLPNRYLLQADFSRKLEESGRNGKMLATLFFDLDHFKEVNDVHGHETGDALLKQVAKRMSEVTRNYDLLARFGGDEFVMIMSNLNDRQDVNQVVEKIIAGFEPAFDLLGASVHITTSVGISIFPEDGNDPNELLKNADLAMYRAKAEGRNCYQFFSSEMNLELQYSQWVATNLRKALDDNRLKLYFQPQVNLETGAVESCEALIRWPQEDGENINPGDFIKIAERTGQIVEVSNWVVNEACRVTQQWMEQGYETVRVDVNLSSKDFANRGVLYKFLQIIQRHHLKASQIGIEIAENIMLDSTDQVINALTVLHNAGVHISIDDFGTGYSSLNSLKRLPLSGIKIDESFVHAAPNSKDDLTIMQAITLAGQGFGLNVIAEGVETEWHQTLCKEVGCNTIQGNYESKPLTAEDFATQYLKKK
jgi:diguanylate cyclase (GGDEF)-like protein